MKTAALVKNIVSSCLEGALDSARRYNQISGGMNVHDHSIENFVSGKIAEKLFNDAQWREPYVCLEVPFSSVMYDARASNKGRIRSTLPSRARFDITCYRGADPIAVIEVKKRFSLHSLRPDLIRVSNAVDRYGANFGGSLKFGFLVAIGPISEGHRFTGENRIAVFKEKASAEFPRLKINVFPREEEGSFGWDKRSRSIIGFRAYVVSVVGA